MKIFSIVAVLVTACAGAANAQMGRTTDWWTYGGDAQRSGWEKNEQKFTKNDVKDFQLLWRMKLENQQKGIGSLMPPLILGNLIGYRGFKELAFVAGSSDNLWAIDVDLAKMYWQKHFETSSSKARGSRPSSACPGTLTAMPTLPAPIAFRFGRAAAAAPVAPQTPPPGGQPGVPAGPSGVPGGAGIPGGGPGAPAGGPPAGAPAGSSSSAVDAIFRVRPVYVLSSDGMLHRLNQANGEDLAPPVSFLPANAKPHNLNISENVLYTATGSGCGDTPDAVWAIDLGGPTPNVSSFVSDTGKILGLGGPAVGTNGVVYVLTRDGKLVALTPKDLKLKDYVVLSGDNSKPKNGSKKDPDMNATTPLVFAYKGHDLVVSAGPDSRLYLLDSNALGGEDHKTPLFQSPPLSAPAKSGAHGIWGGLSSWEETDGTRYVLAALWGPMNPELKAPVTNGDTPNGSIVAFKIQEQDGKPALVAAWSSGDMTSPAPPVIAQGVVFALSNGRFTRKQKGSNGNSTHATLYAFDSATGKDIYSTGDQVTAPGTLTGLSLANGRLYFTTTDNTLNVFGKYLETETQP
jgi:outer membrane protein assembly factor BamB